MTKIFIATPAYDGKVNVQYAVALTETYCDLARNGILSAICINCSGSLLCAERNRLVKQFLATDCTHMLFIDSDLGWPFIAVRSLLQHDVDFVGGVYPTRRETRFLFRPRLNPDTSILNNGKGLIGMEAIPAGFMLIKRELLEKVISDNPQLYYKPKGDPNAQDGYCLFNTELFEGEFWGEDYSFCRLVRASGFDIWVDPMIEFYHCGVIGQLMQALTQNKEKAANIPQLKG